MVILRLNQMPANNPDTSILIVDDDVLLRRAIQDMLEISGYQVWVAANAQDGLRFLKTADRLPDVIISDFRLPGIDGAQFLERVSANVSWKHIPFIFISGSQEELTRSWINWESNVIACLPKPFAIQALFDAVAQATSMARTT